MSEPSPSSPRPELVPPLSDNASQVERESAREATRRAQESDRISGSFYDDECPTTRACEALDRFIHSNPVASVGLAFGIGLVLGAALRLDHH